MISGIVAGHGRLGFFAAEIVLERKMNYNPSHANGLKQLRLRRWMPESIRQESRSQNQDLRDPLSVPADFAAGAFDFSSWAIKVYGRFTESKNRFGLLMRTTPSSSNTWCAFCPSKTVVPVNLANVVVPAPDADRIKTLCASTSAPARFTGGLQYRKRFRPPDANNVCTVKGLLLFYAALKRSVRKPRKGRRPGTGRRPDADRIETAWANADRTQTESKSSRSPE
jgi:hypothetical protein